MNKLIGLFALILSITLTGCGYDEFQGRFVGPEGNVSYEFNTDGTLEIHQGKMSLLPSTNMIVANN